MNERPAVHLIDLPSRFPEIYTRVLSNGIRLHHLAPGNEQVARVMLIWPGGTVEARNQEAALLSAQLLMTSSGDLSRDKVADIIDTNGALLQSNVTQHHSSTLLCSLCDRLPATLDLLTELYENPEYEEPEFILARTRQAARLETSVLKTGYQASMAEGKRIFGSDHPMSHIPDATVTKSITIEEIKSSIPALRDNGMPDVFISGFLPQTIIELIADKLGKLSTRTESIALDIQPPHPTGDYREEITMPDAHQCSVRMTFPTIDRRHNDYCSLKFTIQILGGYFGSRLMQEIRERQGLTYGIEASLLGYNEGGFITISSSCDVTSVDRLITETKHQLNLMTQTDITTDELERARRMSLTMLASTFDTSHSIMDFVVSGHRLGFDTSYYQSQVKAITEATPESIKIIARKYLTPNPYITIAGNLPR